MPIYEYQCTNCQHHFDLMQKINDLPVTQCPACHKESVTKLISAAGFQLKGTGWYATDFKNKNTQPKEPSTKNEPAAGEAKETTSAKTTKEVETK